MSGTLAVVDAEHSSNAALGIQAAFHLLGNGVDSPFEVSTFAGYGYYDRPEPLVFLESFALRGDDLLGTAGNWRLVAGGSVVAAITTPYASIRPWFAPRLEMFQLTVGDATSDETRFAGSAGIDVRFPGGPGLRFMWDQVDGWDSTLGVGLSYRF